MARPKKDAAVDLRVTHDLSIGLIERLTCPPGSSKAFLRDKDVTGLRVRVTANGAKSFVYEAKLNGKAISRTLGGFPLMSIGEARQQARDLARTIKNDKQDPRELDRQRAKEQASRSAAAAAQDVSVGEVWVAYLADRRPHWGDRHYDDHIKLSRAGGKPKLRGSGLTVDMPLYPLMALPLQDLTATTIEKWAAREGKVRPTPARLSWRLLKAFLNWCAEQEQYAPALPSGNPAKTRKTRDALGKSGIKKDALMREQLAAWFAAVRQHGNPTIAAYLQTLLLTGARPGEVKDMRWDDIDLKWRGLKIRDKVEGEREIPLTPYVAQLLAALPRRNGWVFAANPRGKAQDSPIASPNVALTSICTQAGINGLTLHGLRRSFKSLTEWLEIPAGVVAQIMGHKPSATAEKHYTVRPLDLLRVHHERIEAWILEQAGVPAVSGTAPGKLALIADKTQNLS